jgi:hypothetical protein
MYNGLHQVKSKQSLQKPIHLYVMSSFIIHTTSSSVNFYQCFIVGGKRIPATGAGRDQWAEEDNQAPTAAYYLCIHYADQSFKFFPFFNSEIAEIIGALSDLIGQDPFDEYDYVQMILRRKQEALRASILADFSGHKEQIVDPTSMIDDHHQHNPHAILAATPPAWINHTIPLTHVIDALTSDTRDQRVCPHFNFSDHATG